MTAAYQPNAYQKSAYQANGGVSRGAFQPNAFQFNAFQEDARSDIPAFDGCAFQFNAFQSAPCPIPPPPVPDYDSHDGGKKQKRLRKLEEKRIQLVREQAEQRKLMLTHAFDPQAKAEYEAKMAKLADQGKPQEHKNAAEIAKIDREISRIEKVKENQKYNALITNELNRIHYARQLQEHEFRRQILEKEDELALMMMM